MRAFGSSRALQRSAALSGGRRALRLKHFRLRRPGFGREATPALFASRQALRSAASANSSAIVSTESVAVGPVPVGDAVQGAADHEGRQLGVARNQSTRPRSRARSACGRRDRSGAWTGEPRRAPPRRAPVVETGEAHADIRRHDAGIGADQFAQFVRGRRRRRARCARSAPRIARRPGDRAHTGSPPCWRK